VQSRHLDLNTIDSVDAVDEEDQDEYERNLHAVLHLRHDWTLGDEVEHLPLHCEGHGDDKDHEEDHLCHEKGEDLAYALA
jgi:hypothetical protein